MKENQSNTQNKPLIKRWWIYAIFITLVIGLPLLINYLYFNKWAFSSGEILTYCSIVLTMMGAMIGVFLSIDYSQRNYREDILKRVFPFITCQERTTIYSDKHFKEENRAIEKIYFIMDKNGYSFSEVLSKEQMGSIDYDFSIEDGVNIVEKKTIRFYSRYFVNVGVGTAVNCGIDVKKIGDTAWLPSHIDVSLLPGQKIYMGIYVDGSSFNEFGDSYLIRLTYSDIYGINYKQDWTFFASGNGYVEYESIGPEKDLS